MQSAQNQIEPFLADGLCHQPCGSKAVHPRGWFLGDVDGAVSTFGQRLADGLLHARRPNADDHHLAAVLLFELQRGFQRIGIRLVHLITEVAFADPARIFAEAQGGIFGGNLFDTYDNLHGMTLRLI